MNGTKMSDNDDDDDKLESFWAQVQSLSFRLTTQHLPSAAIIQ